VLSLTSCYPTVLRHTYYVVHTGTCTTTGGSILRVDLQVLLTYRVERQRESVEELIRAKWQYRVSASWAGILRAMAEAAVGAAGQQEGN
jgi:hypothetical protein